MTKSKMRLTLYAKQATELLYQPDQLQIEEPQLVKQGENIL